MFPCPHRLAHGGTDAARPGNHKKMTPVFSPDIIARVKDETDIVEIVRQHVSLKPAGAVYKGLCPFHKEKTPSFIVTPARQRYHCSSMPSS